MTTYATFEQAIARITEDFRHQSYPVRTEKWQGLSISEKPEMAMRELLFRSFSVPMRGIERLDHWQLDIKPNLPFADKHFNERVSGDPTNPGEAWKIWPWANAADKHRTAGEFFTHTYQERFWPKHAGGDNRKVMGLSDIQNWGIRYRYGDLNDVVELLHREPLTRQAYLPIFFPEDTGAVHGGRIPCTLGYQFINRHDYLHISYGIRSCDFVRHFRDDCYFAVRLVLWILDRLREKDSQWTGINPGLFKMDIGSLHMFINDFNRLK